MTAAVAPETSPSAPAGDSSCYHCGLPIPDGVNLPLEVDGNTRRMCCVGCQAVAKAIVGNGLTDYYRHRDAMPETSAEGRREAIPDALKDLGLFDHPDVQSSFVAPVGEHEREASLILEGITCAACVWLNEQHVARQPGVTAVDINYATRRARVRWDERRIKLSQILGAIAAIGYRAYPYDAARSEEISQRERRGALWRLFVAGFGMMQVMMYAVPVYMADEGTMSVDIEQLMRWASLLLTLPVVLYSAAPFFQRAWRDLRLRRVGMDVPVALGVASAFAASVWATFTGGGEVYFDSVTMFVFFLLCGRYLEMIARQRAVRGVEQLARIMPAFAARLPGFPDLEAERVPVAQLRPGDLVLVKPGEAMPADGRVRQGTSRVDESLLTGESRPVEKAEGSEVTGGSINAASPLVVEVERVGTETRLAAIQRLMERAAAEKPRIVETADKVAAGFVAVLLVVAVATGLVWLQLDPGRALWVFVAVLVVSCPCALSLATPAALTVATGALSRIGMLATRGHAIEALARANHFVFDKTGTLTFGRLKLASVVCAPGLDQAEMLALAAALEAGSEHAVAAALREAAGGRGVGVTQILAVTGQGMEGLWLGRRVRIGRPAFVAELRAGLPDSPAADDARYTVVELGDESRVLARFCLSDQLRPEAAALVRALQADGAQVTVLSGDGQETVSRVAASLGLEDAHGGMTPQGKHDFIRTLQAEGCLVAMVGDGVNDAPVLAQAQVSVAMGGGTELARTQGDFVLLNEHLSAIAQGRHLARATVRVIRQNLWWAFAYNFIALPLAMAGYITPWLAGIGMAGSSLLVVLNALRLQRSPEALAVPAATEQNG